MKGVSNVICVLVVGAGNVECDLWTIMWSEFSGVAVTLESLVLANTSIIFVEAAKEFLLNKLLYTADTRQP